MIYNFFRIFCGFGTFLMIYDESDFMPQAVCSCSVISYRL